MDRPAKTSAEVRKNVALLHRYRKGSLEQRKFYKRTIKNGKLFVAIRQGNSYTFAPSKFAGYPNNNIEHKERLYWRDGRITNPVLDKLFGPHLHPGDKGYTEIDRAFHAYCGINEITPSSSHRPHRYWIFDNTNITSKKRHSKDLTQRERLEAEAEALESLSLESLMKKYRSKYRPNAPKKKVEPTTVFERAAEVIAIAKVRANFRCELNSCAYPTFKTSRGKRYCEVHHIIALSEGGADTVENVACLCATHHREAHVGNRRDKIRAQLKRVRRQDK